MPHKKAKRSIREKTKSEQGTDLAPTKSALTDEAMPKSAHRILNAIAIRDQFKKRKAEGEEGREGKRRKGDDANGNGKGKSKGKATTLKIQPGESIQHFNRRVEDDLRPLVKSAVQASRAAVRNSEREAKAKSKRAHPDSDSEASSDNDDSSRRKSSNQKSKRAKSSSPPPPVDKHASKPKEFATLSSSAPKRLNDIAMAPPEFKKLPRGAAPTSASGSAMGRGDGVLSMAQKLMMEREREKAILRYRELKAARAKE
ncbi:hypothetical protein BJ165DRAFT_1312251, partial [Panaeolus papilionaceus]